MPNVTIDPNNHERFYLETAKDPTDPGWVDLRPLPYGLKLTRRDKMSKMSMRADDGKKGKNNEGGEITLESFNEWAVQFDFEYCIVDHNLLDSQGTKLDFSNKLVFRMLDPRVGSEIERLINNLNDPESDESLEDFLQRSSTSSTEDLSESSSTDSLNETPTATQ